MQRIYNWLWVEARAAETADAWKRSAEPTRLLPAHPLPRYTVSEQQQREAAYDEGQRAVERELKKSPRSRSARVKTQHRIIAAFAQFSASVLDLEPETVKLLTNDFLPVGTGLARWARSFDPTLSMPDIIQACRNAWTACGLQPLLGAPVALTPSILGYSLLYPYSDNFLDREDVSSAEKLRFSRGFRERLRGASPSPKDGREIALWKLVELIETQYPRAHYPDVYACLLAIHRAQEESVQQVESISLTGSAAQAGSRGDDAKLLRITCAKGGTSVLADACLARGALTPQESRFAFDWGVLLQLGDDLQDVREDMRRGSVTLFSRAAAQGASLDSLTLQLLSFSERVAADMDQLPHGDARLKALLRMSWRSLILRAVADSHEYFSPAFLDEAERCSPFRFDFLRTRNQRLAGRQGLYATLFQAFLGTPEA